MEAKKDAGGIRLTSSEWSVLACLWEDSPRTVMQLVAVLSERVGWAKSTTITTLRRMEEKGLLHCEQTGKGKLYSPAVEREQAVTAETHSFLDRVYQGSVGLMMSAMAKRQELSADEVAELRAILDQIEGRDVK
ncbi:MAG: BlaI/MecI/CopY family transcriptional regulator [Clostridiales bacterium]|nr:BlaI/MecI/CopY family transcriptional regulator [Clostridiales bacterium]